MRVFPDLNTGDLAGEFMVFGEKFADMIKHMGSRGLPREYWLDDVLPNLEETGLAFLRAIVAAAEKAQAEEGGAS